MKAIIGSLFATMFIISPAFGQKQKLPKQPPDGKFVTTTTCLNNKKFEDYVKKYQLVPVAQTSAKPETQIDFLWTNPTNGVFYTRSFNFREGVLHCILVESPATKTIDIEPR